MLKRAASLLLLSCGVVALLLGQGLTPPPGVDRDDWEEINFEFNSSILSDGYPSLLRLAELLQKNPGYRLGLEGHADRIGSDRYNEKLGMARATTVKSFLTKYGAADNQIEIVSQGEREPRVPIHNKEGRFINRRVEMTLLDANGKEVGAGGVQQVIEVLPKEAVDKCCADILKRLDRLDEIVSMLKGLQGLRDELDALKKDQAKIREQIAGLPKPLTRDEVTDITRTTTADELERARMKRFTLLGLNAGVDGDGDFTATGKGRFFAPFKDRMAFQSEGEFMYFRDRKEGQLDFGIVDRFHSRGQFGLFASFKHVHLSGMQSGGTLGQASATLDYIFRLGRLGLFGSKGFMQEDVINRAATGRNTTIETYLRTVDQIGASATIGLAGSTYLEGNLGYLKSHAHADRIGGTLRFVFPLSDRFAFTLEGGLNETLITRDNNGRVVAGFAFGNFMRPKDYMGVDHAVPAMIPRVRYDLLTRRIQTGNDAPVVVVSDIIGAEAGNITLDASGSFDPDGDPITFEWSQVGGPAVNLSGRMTSRATFTAAAGQNYSFRVTVRDDKGAQSVGSMRVSTEADPEVQIARFQANPTLIRPGQTSTLTWNVLNADSVEITSLGRVDGQGTSTVSPMQTTQYRLTARRGAREISETVTVVVEPLPMPELRFLACTAQPMSLTAGESATLFWSASGATSVSISGGIGPVDTSGTRAVMPTQNTTYTLTATGQGGATTTCTISLQVTETGEVPRIVRFSADPSTITAGDSSTLSWTVEGATNVSISGGIGTVGATGTRQVTPPTTTTYTLTASNAQGNVTATATVTVNPREPPPPPPPTGATLAACLATPATSARPGDPVRLTWTVTNTSSLTVSGGGQTYSPPITGPLSVSPQATTTYIITAQGPQGSQPATCQIVVNVTPAPVNPPPQAIIAGPQVIETIYRELTLDASPSVNPAGGPLTYTWEPLETGAAVLDQGQVRTRIQLAGLFGDYRIRLTVRNAQGQTASTIVTVRFLSAQLF